MKVGQTEVRLMEVKQMEMEKTKSWEDRSPTDQTNGSGADGSQTY